MISTQMHRGDVVVLTVNSPSIGGDKKSGFPAGSQFEFRCPLTDLPKGMAEVQADYHHGDQSRHKHVAARSTNAESLAVVHSLDASRKRLIFKFSDLDPTGATVMKSEPRLVNENRRTLERVLGFDKRFRNVTAVYETGDGTFAIDNFPLNEIRGIGADGKYLSPKDTAKAIEQFAECVIGEGGKGER